MSPQQSESVETRVLQAVESIVATKGFESVSVVEICREAAISSPTFYKHFSDKYHIAQTLFDRIAEQGLGEIGRSLTWEQGYYRHLALLLKRRDIVKAFMRVPQGYQSLPSYGRRWQKEALRRTIEDVKGLEVDDELAFQINCLVQLETHSAIDWAMGDMMVPEIKTYARWLANAVPRRLFDLLDDPVEPLFGS